MEVAQTLRYADPGVCDSHLYGVPVVTTAPCRHELSCYDTTELIVAVLHNIPQEFGKHVVDRVMRVIGVIWYREFGDLACNLVRGATRKPLDIGEPYRTAFLHRPRSYLTLDYAINAEGLCKPGGRFSTTRIQLYRGDISSPGEGG